MKTLLLFDIDGTILYLKMHRSKYFFNKVFREMFATEIPVEKMPNFSGMTDLKIIEDICLIGDLPLDKVLLRAEEIWERLLQEFRANISSDDIELTPNISNALRFANENSDFSLALVTGNFEANAYFKLRLFDFDRYFPVGAFGSDHANRNLLPSLAIHRANALFGSDFTPENSVVIGDSPSDILCAKASGALSVAVATGHHSSEDLAKYSPDLLFENLTSYKDCFTKILNIINHRHHQ